MSKRLIVIIVTVIIVIIGLVVLLLLRQGTNNTTDDSNKSQDINTSFSVKNFDKYSSNINSETQQRISAAIQRYLEDDGIDTTSVSGVVRDGSLQYSRDGSSVNITFLVDIPSVKRTYKVSLGSDETTGEASLYILCPDDSNRIYPVFKCKDAVSS